VEGAEEVIFSALDWFGLTEDESPRKEGKFGPYRQSERLDIYHKYAQQLLDKDLAYFAFYPKADAGQKKDYSQKEAVAVKVADTTQSPPKTLKEMIERGDWILRMRVVKNNDVVIKDEIRGEITFAADQITEQVLIKSDGFPTYHLAAVIDDHEMGITHVVRGEEWISSTAKHVLLYQYLNWDVPLFFHTTLLRNPDKSKLSKRHGHTSVTWYQEEGFLPQAILNFLALMGWTHPEEKEVFSLNEFISVFDLKDIRQVGPIFDLTKLTWMNQQYIMMKPDEELKKLIISFFPTAKQLPDTTFDKLLPLLKTRMETLKDFAKLTTMFFTPVRYTPTDEKEKQIAEEMLIALKHISDWNKDTVFAVIKSFMEKYSVRMPLFYKLFTGAERGLPLPDILEILGKEKTLDLLTHNIPS
jgi:glutamyl-tRNA synthetase